MTAAEIVALAKKAAAWRFERAASYYDPYSLHVYDDDDFEIRHERDIPREKPSLMRAALTRENTASEDALMRVLLASAVTTADERDEYPSVVARLGDESMIAETHDDARDALLDALLASPDQMTRRSRVPNNQTPSSPPSSSALRTGEKL